MSAQQKKSGGAGKPKPIPENEVKQNSAVSASMALQAMQKAYELRQAANAAGDPDAREEILAKAINKEIEAESFGKAAKYTRSGTFQGLAAGAGLGVQPGVTIGKLTGALVGGTVSTVTGLLGGGIGSVYGAMHGPFWDLGQMASQGVRSIVGDFPNWKSTPAQKKALEKMVTQTKETQAPTKEELEKMQCDDGGAMPETWAKSARDMTSWMPSMPGIPSMPNMPNMPSMPSWGGGQDDAKSQPPKQQLQQNTARKAPPKPKQASGPKQPPKPKEAPTPKEAPKPKAPAQANQAQKRDPPTKSQTSSKPTAATSKPKPAAPATEKKKPRKLNSTPKSSTDSAPQKKKPRKLERKPAA